MQITELTLTNGSTFNERWWGRHSEYSSSIPAATRAAVRR
jgi:hypothetical protein